VLTLCLFRAGVLGYLEGAVLRLIADDQAPHAGAAAMDGVDEGVDGLGRLRPRRRGRRCAIVRRRGLCVSSGWILSEVSSPALSSSRSRPNVFAPLPTIGGGHGRDLLDLVVAQHARRANEPALGLSFFAALFSGLKKSEK
jgi:hypothetical protein